MECLECGSEIRDGSSFCHECGAKVRTRNPELGKRLFLISFLLIFLLPAIYRTLNFINIVNLLNVFDIGKFLDLMLTVVILFFFYLMWKGKSWPKYPIAAIVFINQALFLISFLISGEPFLEHLRNIVTSVGYVAIGYSLMISEDVRAFVEERGSQSP